jgi:hypothetical protein
MGFVDKAAFKNARAMLFPKVEWDVQQFLVGFIKKSQFFGRLPWPYPPPLKHL